jgi:hypothetical protein
LDSDDALLRRFVESFAVFDQMAAWRELDPHAWGLRLGKPGPHGYAWRPRRVHLPGSALESLHRCAQRRYPPLFERLLLSYRWAAVELPTCCLLASPRSRGLEGFVHEVFRDQGLTETLLPAGYLPFARGSGGSYDPVCFASIGSDGDAPAVQLDHEAILIGQTISVVRRLAPSFRQLVLDTLDEAGRRADQQPPLRTGGPGLP